MIGITTVLKRGNDYSKITIEFDEEEEYGEWMFLDAIYDIFDKIESEITPSYEEVMAIKEDYRKFKVWTTDEFIKGEPGADYFDPDEFMQTIIDEVILWDCYSVPKWSDNPEDLVQNEEVIYRRKSK